MNFILINIKNHIQDEKTIIWITPMQQFINSAIA